MGKLTINGHFQVRKLLVYQRVMGNVIGNIRGMHLRFLKIGYQKKVTMADHGTVLSHGPS